MNCTDLWIGVWLAVAKHAHSHKCEAHLFAATQHKQNLLCVTMASASAYKCYLRHQTTLLHTLALLTGRKTKGGTIKAIVDLKC